MTNGIGLFWFFRTPFADNYRQNAHNNSMSTLNPTEPLSAPPQPPLPRQGPGFSDP
jgi:hypothetical protein